MILCIESLAGSFENCVQLGIDNKITKELQWLQNKEGKIFYLSKDTRKYRLGKNIAHMTLPRHTPAVLRNMVYLLYPFFNLKVFRKCDTYYIHNISGCLPAVIAKFLLGNKKIIARYDWNWSFTFKQKYNIFIYQVTKILERICLRQSDVVIATTKRLRRDVHAITKDPQKKVVVLPNWVDRHRFKPAKQKAKRVHPIVVNIGRLDDGKNQLLLLQSIRKVRMNSIRPKTVIIGRGEKKEALQTYAKKNNIPLELIERVPNEEIPTILHDADLFVMTSKYEGLPHVLLEALACGLPVVGSNVRGINDIIRHNYNGVLCQQNPDDIAAAITSVLRDQKKYDTLRRNGFKSVQAYSFEAIMNQIYFLLKNDH